MATLKKELRDILDRYGIDYRDKDKLWDCHGTLVLYHKAYEIIAAQEGIRFDPPIVLEANGAAKSVALCVVGHMGDRSEWATGEAAPGNNKNAYPYAMAEKRAKDRCIAKLVGLAAYVLSEDEAEEFKAERKPVEVADAKPAPMPEPSPGEPGKPITHTLRAEFVRDFWNRASYTVEVKSDRSGPNWTAWFDWMWQLGQAAPTLDCIVKLQDDNRANLAGFRLVSASEHRKLLDHFALVERAHGKVAA